MVRRPPRVTSHYALLPYTAPVRSALIRHQAAHAVGNGDGDLGIDVRHHDDEFLAAVARHQVDVAHAPRYPLGQLDQHLVAALVAVAVVDALELVDVEHQHRDRLHRLCDLHDLAVEMGIQIGRAHV